MDNNKLKTLKKSVDYIEDKILDYVQKESKDSKILDIATGRGYLLKVLENAGYKNLYCADLNAKNFAFDSKKYNFQNINANLKLPYNDNSFDIVISSETIEHLENPRGFLRELHRVCKKGGVVILTTPNIDTVFSRIYYLFTGILAGHTKASYEISGHIAVLPDFLLIRFIEELNFVDIQKTYNCGYIPVLKLKFKNLLLNPLFGWITIYALKK